MTVLLKIIWRLTLSGYSMFSNVSHFPIGSLFYHYMFAGGYFGVDGGEWGGNIKRNTVELCYYRYLIGSDFVGSVTVRSHLEIQFS